MANIDRIVNVQIALRTAGARQLSFSDLLLVGEHGNANRINIITGADQLLTDASYALTEASPLYQAALAAFSQIPTVNRLYIGKRITAEAPAVTMAALRVADDTWYAFAEPVRTAADIPLFAAWGEANQKLFLTGLTLVQTQGVGAANIANVLKVGNFFRTIWMLVPAINQFPEIALAAKKFTIMPGGETWANARLQGVQSVPLTETVYQGVTALNGNTFEPFRNVSITQNGVTAGGEWIDIIRFRDWLCEEIKTRVFNKLVDNRITYTDDGIAIIRQAMQEALDLGVRRGGIPQPEANADNTGVIPSYTISMPRSALVSQPDKAARILRDAKFTARLAGAIHVVNINGNLTYDNIG